MMSVRLRNVFPAAVCAIAALAITGPAGLVASAQSSSPASEVLLKNLSREDRAKLEAKLAALKPMTPEQLEGAIAAAVERQNAILAEMDEPQLSALAARGDEVWRDCALAHRATLFVPARPDEAELRAKQRGYRMDMSRIRATLYENAHARLSGRDDYAENGDAKIVEVRDLIEKKPSDTRLQLYASAFALRCDTLLLATTDQPSPVEATLMNDPVRAAKEAAEQSE